MSFRNLFSDRLAQLRKENGLSYAQLGKQLGVSDEAVRLMEKSKRSPSFEVLCALAEVFDVPVGLLVGAHGTDLSEANLSQADMREVKACGALFVLADLSHADLRNADLRWADFTNANLHKAKLEGARINGAIFTGADVSGTILDINPLVGRSDDPSRH